MQNENKISAETNAHYPQRPKSPAQDNGDPSPTSKPPPVAAAAGASSNLPTDPSLSKHEMQSLINQMDKKLDETFLSPQDTERKTVDVNNSCLIDLDDTNNRDNNNDQNKKAGGCSNTLMEFSNAFDQKPSWTKSVGHSLPNGANRPVMLSPGDSSRDMITHLMKQRLRGNLSRNNSNNVSLSSSNHSQKSLSTFDSRCSDTSVTADRPLLLLPDQEEEDMLAYVKKAGGKANRSWKKGTRDKTKKKDKSENAADDDGEDGMLAHVKKAGAPAAAGKQNNHHHDKSEHAQNDSMLAMVKKRPQQKNQVQPTEQAEEEDNMLLHVRKTTAESNDDTAIIAQCVNNNPPRRALRQSRRLSTPGSTVPISPYAKVQHDTAINGPMDFLDDRRGAARQLAATTPLLMHEGNAGGLETPLLTDAENQLQQQQQQQQQQQHHAGYENYGDNHTLTMHILNSIVSFFRRSNNNNSDEDDLQLHNHHHHHHRPVRNDSHRRLSGSSSVSTGSGLSGRELLSQSSRTGGTRSRGSPYSSGRSHRQHRNNSSSSSWTLAQGLVWLIFAAAILSSSFFVVRHEMSCYIEQKKNHHPNNDDLFPQAKRLQQILKCASFVSNNRKIFEKENSPQATAAYWFLLGGGRNLPVLEKGHDDNDDDDICCEEFAQLYSLIVIRESLKVIDAAWYNDKKLKSYSDICHWPRIHCSDDNHFVTSIELNNANLTGYLPDELFNGGLPILQSLQLFSNEKLKGTIPASISKLSDSLVSLGLHKTSISGTVPSTLGQLTRLEKLYLEDTQLTGTVPESVCELEHLSIKKVSCESLSCDCCTCSSKRLSSE